MKRKLTLEEVAAINRKRYDCDYKRLMEQRPHYKRNPGNGLSLFEQYELQRP